MPIVQRKQHETPRGAHNGLSRFVVGLGGVFVMSIPAAILLILVAFLIILLTGSIGYLTSFFLILGFILFCTSLRRLKTERKTRLLNYLKLATEKNLPLPEFLDTLRRGEGLSFGKRAERIANDLRLGSSLGEALIVHVPEIPLHQSAVIWRGEQAGRLTEAIARVADSANDESRITQSGRNDVALQYGLFIFFVLQATASYMGFRVIPMYASIFGDFDTQLPHITWVTFNLVQTLSPIFGLLSIFAVLGMIGWTMHGVFLTNEKVVGPITRVLEPIWWRVPVLSAGFRSRALADACFMIEQSMRAGRPLPEAIEASRHPLQSRVMDRRLQRFAAGLREGKPMQDAARCAGLPALIVGMLGTASAAAQPAEVFAFLCRYYSERVSPLEALIKASALPLATLLAAVCVAWFVFSIFYPLIVLIEATIEATGLA